MQDKYRELLERLREIDDLRGAEALLIWDQMTYLPAGAAQARGRRNATLSRLAHERLTDPALGRLLDELVAYETSLPYDSDAAGVIRAARRDFDRAVCVPARFMAEIDAHLAETYAIWTSAKAGGDFSLVLPYLEKTLDLSRRFADYFPGYGHIADPLIDLQDHGVTVSSLRPLFAELRAGLIPIIKAIAGRDPVDASFLHQVFPAAAQIAFCLEAAKRIGYDFTHGRLDESPHPFTIKLSVDDVRITTRVREDDLSEAVFGTLHEAGHALYDQGFAPDLEGTPLAEGSSSGVHESQSRLWENLVGRSLGFWRFYYPRLQQSFPEQLGRVSLEAFHRGINRVDRSLIRTEADEVTYNLHVTIRFDLELALLEGALAVRDLPEAWHERYRTDLGIAATNDRQGVLQDVHWFGGLIGGAFQGYTLGNVMAAQFYAAALQAHPEIPAEIEDGQFSTLLGWLRRNIHCHGRKFTATELIQRICGGPLQIAPYLHYLREKYQELYGAF